jgi:hypothetical protein
MATLGPLLPDAKACLGMIRIRQSTIYRKRITLYLRNTPCPGYKSDSRNKTRCLYSEGMAYDWRVYICFASGKFFHNHNFDAAEYKKK